MLIFVVDENETVGNDTTTHMNNNNNDTAAIDPEELSAREKNYKHVLLQVKHYPCIKVTKCL